MTEPMRIQLSSKKGWRLPPDTVVVSRPSRWGNPHRIGDCPVCGAEHTREEAVAEFRAELMGNSLVMAEVRRELRGKHLACWCKMTELCHADVILAVANAKQEGPQP